MDIRGSLICCWQDFSSQDGHGPREHIVVFTDPEVPSVSIMVMWSKWSLKEPNSASDVSTASAISQLLSSNIMGNGHSCSHTLIFFGWWALTHHVPPILRGLITTACSYTPWWPLHSVPPWFPFSHYVSCMVTNCSDVGECKTWIPFLFSLEQHSSLPLDYPLSFLPLCTTCWRQLRWRVRTEPNLLNPRQIQLYGNSCIYLTFIGKLESSQVNGDTISLSNEASVPLQTVLWDDKSHRWSSLNNCMPKRGQLCWPNFWVSSLNGCRDSILNCTGSWGQGKKFECKCHP